MSRFTCSPGDKHPGRRAVLAGGSAILAVGTVARADESIAFGDLVDADGRIMPQAAVLAGRYVRVVGYLSPSFDPGDPDWRLTEAPAMPCQLCGSGHSDGPIVIVRPAQASDQSPFHAVAVIARVELSDAAPRLVDACFEAI